MSTATMNKEKRNFWCFVAVKRLTCFNFEINSRLMKRTKNEMSQTAILTLINIANHPQSLKLMRLLISKKSCLSKWRFIRPHSKIVIVEILLILRCLWKICLCEQRTQIIFHLWTSTIIRELLFIGNAVRQVVLQLIGLFVCFDVINRR